MRAFHESPANMKNTDQREKAACGIEIQPNLIFETLTKELRSLIMEPPAAHIDGLNLIEGGVFDRLIIALANQKIVFDGFAKRCQRQQHFAQGLPRIIADIKHQAVFFNGEMQPVGSRFHLCWRKAIVFQQIEDGDFALMLNVGAAPNGRLFLQYHIDDAVLG